MASHWVGTWSATPAPADGVALSSPTIRMFPRVSIGGDTIRVRLSNAAGTGDLTIGRRMWRSVARAPVSGPAPTGCEFNGSASVKIPGGAFVVSDPVSLTVAPLEDLAVSIYVPGEIPASFGVTGRYARHSITCRRRAISPDGGHVRKPRDRRLVLPVRHRCPGVARRRRDRRTGGIRSPMATFRRTMRFAAGRINWRGGSSRAAANCSA